MRNRLRFRPDSSGYSLLTGVNQELPCDTSPGPESGTSLSELAAALSLGDGASSTDLALDLVLNEIAEQVRLSTGATGVAVALTRSGELVCRAATGSAPDLGVRLNPYSGLSGLCLQTRSVQGSEDTEADSRVDFAACRNLRIRSILMAPLIRSGDIVGLLEAFSVDPNHFSDRDAEILLSFCKRIVNTIESSDEIVAPSHSGVAHELQKTVGATHRGGSPIRVSKSASWDRWTVFLTVAVIASALALGWVLGLTDRHKVAIGTPARLDAKTHHASQDQKIPNKTAAGLAASADIPAPQTSLPRTPTRDSSESKSTETQNPSGGLVIFQNGKVVFRETPPAPPRSRRNRTVSKSTRAIHEVIIPPAIIPAAKTELLPSEAANQYVSFRVQPEYPEIARKQHIQGPVLLKVLVGKDGSVQQVQVMGGDSKLAAAAADAVVQWRFKPVLRLEQPVEFQTQITVDFKLP
jgi:TonB family protein